MLSSATTIDSATPTPTPTPLRPMRAVVACVGLGLLAVSLAFMEHVDLYLLAGAMLLCLALPFWRDWTRGRLDLFEPIHVYGGISFLYFGVAAIWIAENPQWVAYDRYIVPYVAPAALYCLLGYVMVLAGYYAPWASRSRPRRAVEEQARGALFLIIPGGLGLMGQFIRAVWNQMSAIGGSLPGLVLSLSQFAPLFLFAWSLAWLQFFSGRSTRSQRWVLFGMFTPSVLVILYLTISTKFSVRLTGFWGEVDDLIQRVELGRAGAEGGVVGVCGFLPPNGRCRQRRNLGQMRSYGVEIDGDYRPVRHWRLTFAGTIQDTEITSNPSEPDLVGNSIEDSPDEKYAVAIHYDHPRLLHAMLRGRHVGSRFDDTDNEEPLESYTVLDLSLSRALSSEWSVFAGIENVLDDQFGVNWRSGVIEIGLPRLVRVGVRVGQHAQASTFAGGHLGHHRAHPLEHRLGFARVHVGGRQGHRERGPALGLPGPVDLLN